MFYLKNHKDFIKSMDVVTAGRKKAKEIIFEKGSLIESMRVDFNSEPNEHLLLQV